VGILVFLGGIALLVVTFRLAYDLYNIPPEQALKLDQQKAIDVAATGNSLAGIVIRSLLLLVMGLVSSVIAGRGVQLYSHSVVREHSTQVITEAPTKPQEGA
jgi:hypothetical protein